MILAQGGHRRADQPLTAASQQRHLQATRQATASRHGSRGSRLPCGWWSWHFLWRIRNRHPIAIPRTKLLYCAAVSGSEAAACVVAVINAVVMCKQARLTNVWQVTRLGLIVRINPFRHVATPSLFAANQLHGACIGCGPLGCPQRSYRSTACARVSVTRMT